MSSLSGMLGQLYMGWQVGDPPPSTSVTDYAADKAAGVVSLSRARALRNELARCGFSIDGAPAAVGLPPATYLALAAQFIQAGASLPPGKGPAGKGDAATVGLGLLYRDFLRSRQVSPAKVESLLAKLSWYDSNAGKPQRLSDGAVLTGAGYAPKLSAETDGRLAITFTGQERAPVVVNTWGRPAAPSPWGRPASPSPLGRPASPPVDLSAAGEEIRDLVRAGYGLDEVIDEVLGGGKPAEVLPLREYRALRRGAPAAAAPAAPVAPSETEPTE